MNSKKTGKKKVKKSGPLAKIPEKKKQSLSKFNDVNSLIETALKNKSGVDQLKELMAMKYKHEEREAKKIFHDHFCQMQKHLPSIPRTKQVDTKTGKKMYRYATLDKMVELVKPVLSDHGFSYGWSESFPDVKIKRVTFHVTGYDHTESCYIDIPIMSANDYVNDIQQSGSSSTYGRRYTMMNMLGLVCDDDDDARGSTQEPAPAAEPKKEKPKTEVIPPSKPRLPDNIKSTDECKLGKYKDTPVKFNKVPLPHLLAFQSQASNPEALDQVIHETIDRRITDYKTTLKYTDDDLKAMIKVDLKKDSEYVDLNQAEKITVLKKMKTIVEKLEGGKDGK
jgi:hypothetical protein